MNDIPYCKVKLRRKLHYTTNRMAIGFTYEDLDWHDFDDSDTFYHIPDIKNEWTKFKVFNSKLDIIEWLDLDEMDKFLFTKYEYKWSFTKDQISESEVKLRAIK